MIDFEFKSAYEIERERHERFEREHPILYKIVFGNDWVTLLIAFLGVPLCFVWMFPFFELAVLGTLTPLGIGMGMFTVIEGFFYALFRMYDY